MRQTLLSPQGNLSWLLKPLQRVNENSNKQQHRIKTSYSFHHTLYLPYLSIYHKSLYMLSVCWVKTYQSCMFAICLWHWWLMKVKLFSQEPLFSLEFSVKGYTSSLPCALCGNLRDGTREGKRDRWIFLAGYPVLSRAAGPTLTSSTLLTPDLPLA